MTAPLTAWLEAEDRLLRLRLSRLKANLVDEMNIALHELGPMAMKSDRPARINSTCTVFARRAYEGGARTEASSLSD